MANGRASTDFQNSYLTDATSTVLDPSTDALSCCIWCYWTDSAVRQSCVSQLDGTGTGAEWMKEQSNGIRSLIGGTTSASPTVLDTWNHWAMSFAGGTGDLTMYIDGVSKNTQTRTGVSCDGNMRAFANLSGADDVNDAVAFVAVFEIQLTEAHIQEIQYQPFAHSGIIWMPDILQDGTYRDLSPDQNGNPTITTGTSITASSLGPPVYLLGGQ